MLTEDERNILLGQAPVAGTTDQALAARSLIGTKRDLRGSATVNRKILGDVSATLNTELEHQEGRSLIGLGETLVEPLARNTSSDSAHAGIALNGTKKDWRWTLTGNADLDRNITRTDRDDPAGLPATAPARPAARATSRRPPTANCSSFPPATPARRSRSAATRQHLDSHRFTAGADRSDFARTHDGAGGDQPRPAGLAPQPRLQRARQPHAQRQCGGRSAVGLRDSHDLRRRRELVAGRSPQLHHQLDPRGGRADHQPARRPGARNPGQPHLRFHDRADGARHGGHRRQSRPRSPTSATCGSSAPIGSRSPIPSCGCAPIMCARTSTARSRTSP